MKQSLKRIAFIAFLAGQYFSTIGQKIITVKDEVILKGIFTNSHHLPDSVLLIVHNTPFLTKGVDTQNSHRKIIKKVVNRSFVFNITDITKPTYILMKNANPLYEGSKYIMDCFIMEPGDNILMKIGEYFIEPHVRSGSGFLKIEDTVKKISEGVRNISFSGKGFAKYQYLQDLEIQNAKKNIEMASRSKAELMTAKEEGVLFKIPLKSSTEHVKNSAGILKEIQDVNKEIEGDLLLLEMYRKNLSLEMYELLKAKTIALRKIPWFRNNSLRTQIYFYHIETDPPYDSQLVKKELDLWRKLYQDSLLKSTTVNDELITFCPEYLELLVRTAMLSAKFRIGGADAYSLIKSGYSGKLRDYLMAYYLKNNIAYISNRDHLLNDARTFVKDESCLSAIKHGVNNNKGALAYPFSLPDINGQMVKLSDFKNKVVFMDFWYTGCGACRKYYQNVLKPLEEKYKEDSSLIFVTVSVDKSKYFWLKSIEAGIYTGPSISKNIVSLFTGGEGSSHPIISHYSILSYPRPILIGKDGRVFCADNTALRNYEGLEKKINEAKAQKVN